MVDEVITGDKGAAADKGAAGDKGAVGGDKGATGDTGSRDTTLTGDNIKTTALTGGEGDKGDGNPPPPSAEQVAADKALDEATKAGKTEAELAPLKAAKETADKAAKDAADKAKDAKGDKGKTGAPEKYADFKLPDGLEVSPELVTEFGAAAKELNLSQDAAQKLVDIQSKAVKMMGEKQAKAWSDTCDGWVTASKTDKEIGGTDANYNQTIQHGKAFLKAFGTPELLQALDATGTGDHPEFMRIFARAGKLVSEGKLHFGNPAGVADAGKGSATKLYDKSNMNP